MVLEIQVSLVAHCENAHDETNPNCEKREAFEASPEDGDYDDPVAFRGRANAYFTGVGWKIGGRGNLCPHCARVRRAELKAKLSSGGGLLLPELAVAGIA